MSQELEKVEKTEALTRLATARRETLNKLDFDVYVRGLESDSAEVVALACAQLSAEEKGEYEPNFPTLGKVIAQCRKVRHARAETHRLSFESHAPRTLPPPVSDEKFAEIREQFRAVMNRRKVR